MGQTSASFPFGFVQLAPWSKAGYGAAGVRMGQTATYGYVPNDSMPNTFDAIALDLTDHGSPYGDVHIRDKTTVGQRLAAAGLSVAYGVDTYWQGPIGSAASKVDNEIHITFKNPGPNGLEVRNGTVGFELGNAGPEGASHGNSTGWFRAEATLLSDTHTVSLKFLNSSEVTDVQYVRYIWSHDDVKGDPLTSFPCEYKQCGIYAKGLDFPAGPFILKID